MRTRKKHTVAAKLERTLELPCGTLYPALRIELSANRRAVVEGCRRVLCYTDTHIRLRTVDGDIDFEGENLRVDCFADGHAVVSGRFVHLGFSE